MKKIKYILSFILGSLVSTIAIFLIWLHFNTNSNYYPVVYLNIENHSGKLIEKIIINHEKGFVTNFNLEKKEKRVIPIYTAGEGTYKISAYFDEKTMIEADGGYVESNYLVNLSITKDKIEIKSFDV